MRPAEQGRNRRRWLPSNQVTGDALRHDLGALDGRPGTGWRLLWEVQAVQEDSYLPVG
jgi:hypothetical protein